MFYLPKSFIFLGNTLLVCVQEYEDPDDMDEEEIEDRCICFWNLDELTNTSLDIKKVTNRIIHTSMKFPQAMQFCSIVGSDVLVSENDFLVQRSYWP